MDLLDFLGACNEVCELPLAGRHVKLVRHADVRWDLENLRRLGFFEDYQSRQSRDVFSGSQFLISFVAESGFRSRFLGVYEVQRCSESVPPWPDGYPHGHMPTGKYFYDLKKLAGFEALEDRLVIDWGAGTRSWVQWLKPKRVIELLPEGHARDFPGYLDFTLNFEELTRIIEHPEANRIWHTMLRAVAGVYLIADTTTGDLYVGSAYGKDGILGRWTKYVKTKHGNNKELIAMHEKDPDRCQSFLFSILRTLPRTLTDREVIEIESLFKKKLGSRSFGLNCN